MEQLILITEILGLPPHQLLNNAKYRNNFFNQEGKLLHIKDSLNNIHTPGSLSLNKVTGCNNKHFISFIEMIRINSILLIPYLDKKIG